MRRIALAAAGLLALGVNACGDRRQDGGTADTAADRAMQPAPPGTQEEAGTSDQPRIYSFEERGEFAQSVRDRLAQLDREIEQLASQAKSAGGSVSDRALATIRASRKAVDRNLSRVNTATAEGWEEARRGVDQAVERLAEAVEAAYPK